MKRINHQEAYSLDGAWTNWAEEFFSRVRRGEIGHHHHIAGPYLLRFAQEASWREDNRRLSNGEQVNWVAGARDGVEAERDRVPWSLVPGPWTLRSKVGLLSMLLARTFAGFTFLFAVIAGVLFGLAGTLHDGRAWLMLAMFFGCAGVITIWLWFRDKALLERRVKAGPGSEPDPIQNVVQGLAGLVFLATFAVPGLDRRFSWSDVSLAVSLAGDGMIAIGFLIVFLTFRENTFTAGTVEIAEGQHVITSGPYAIVRHPMYAGALVMIVGIPLGAGVVVRGYPGRLAGPGHRVAADAGGGVSSHPPRWLQRLS